MAAIDGSLPSPDRQGFRSNDGWRKEHGVRLVVLQRPGLRLLHGVSGLPPNLCCCRCQVFGGLGRKRHRKRRAKLKKKERRGQSLPSALGSASTDLWCAPGIAFVTGDDSVDCLVSSRDLVGRGGILGVDRVPRDRDSSERRGGNHEETSSMVDYISSLQASLFESHVMLPELYHHLRGYDHRPTVEFEESVLFQHRTLLQGRDAYDRYRDWRLDVDNMTYEELLELGDKIGHVSTGLGEEEVACSIRKVKHSIFFDMRFSSEMDSKCSICQISLFAGLIVLNLGLVQEQVFDRRILSLVSVAALWSSLFNPVTFPTFRQCEFAKTGGGGMITSRALCTLSISRGISIRPLLRKIHGISDATKGKAGLVHPTALVHPDAILGENISVGPFCTIGSAVKVGNSCRIHAGSHIMGRTELGDNCIVLSGAIVGADLPGQTVVGSNNVIGHYAAIGVQCQDLKYKAGDECFLIVGDNNDIREYTSIHRSSKSSDNTVIGSNNLIMGSCHIAHDCKIGNQNIFANNTLLAGHVVIEDFTHTGGAVVVHQFCHVGSYSFIGGGSVIVQDVPRYMMVSGDRAEIRGLNFEGLRRLGFPTSEVRAMRKAYRSIFMSNSSAAGCLDDRLTEVECNGEFAEVSAVSSMVKSIRDSFTESRRGICKFGSRLAS
ncbi:hypothetical protein HPP92_023079 [Vanilla planifolia]|uniref:UDP N-acetylglucosamine O-acyltransferase C-terminal domain-containing protein n=1 Tax=Vanilla planifolia TaxID=51239 RepID=A0A835PTA6_VANPL|nr:hypothetical protein HPP92_023079 [Vanilla planifolia]